MAAIASPTWAEVQRMEPEELQAMNIVKGEVNGDTFLWDQQWYDPETQRMQTGCFKSKIEDDQRRSVGHAEVTR